jgi:excisionase family DNA binding protein
MLGCFDPCYISSMPSTSLNSEDRDFLRWLYGEGDLPQFGVADAARVFGISVSTVRRILREPIAMEPETLSVRQCSVALGISQSKTYQLIRDGQLPAERHGRTIRVNADDLERYRQSARRGIVKTSGFRHL